MSSAKIGDIDVYYEEHGSGEPLLLIMGLAADSTAWLFQIPDFARHYRTIAFDNRGVGRSSKPRGSYTIHQMADDAAGLLDFLEIERAHVVGVSMGGMIAQELALRHPERVRTLHLGCTLARSDAYLRALIEAWRDVRRNLTREASLRAFGLWLFAPATYQERPEFIEMLYQNALANPFPQTLIGFLRQGDAIVTHDALPRLPALRCPTLVSVADEDILVPPRFSREVAACVPGARLEVLSGAGHAYFWERPEAFNALCLDFMGRARS